MVLYLFLKKKEVNMYSVTMYAGGMRRHRTIMASVKVASLFRLLPLDDERATKFAFSKVARWRKTPTSSTVPFVFCLYIQTAQQK